MKTLRAVAAVFCTLSLSVCSADGGKTAAAPATEDEKTLYALGYLVSGQLESFNLKPEEVVQVQKGLADGLTGATPAVNAEEYMQKIQALNMARMQQIADKGAAEGAAYVEKAAQESGATRLASGMVIKHTQEGTGASPAATDQVTVHYEGRLINGEVFDSSMKRGAPATFPLDGVIRCWTEGVQTMKVGGKAQLTCPADLAYGAQGRPGTIPPQATLIFDVELIDIVK